MEPGGGDVGGGVDPVHETRMCNAKNNIQDALDLGLMSDEYAKFQDRKYNCSDLVIG